MSFMLCCAYPHWLERAVATIVKARIRLSMDATLRCIGALLCPNYPKAAQSYFRFNVRLNALA
jgi:hypothetical protein